MHFYALGANIYDSLGNLVLEYDSEIESLYYQDGMIYINSEQQFNLEKKELGRIRRNIGKQPVYMKSPYFCVDYIRHDHIYSVVKIGEYYGIYDETSGDCIAEPVKIDGFAGASSSFLIFGDKYFDPEAKKLKEFGKEIVSASNSTDVVCFHLGGYYYLENIKSGEKILKSNKKIVVC